MHGVHWDSYAEFHQRSAYSAFPQEHRSSRGRLAFSIFRVEQGPHEFIDPRLDETLLALPLAVEADTNCSWTINGMRSRQKARTGTLTVLPAGFESRWEVDGRRTLLTLCIPSATFRQVAGIHCPADIGGTLHGLSTRVWDDPLLRASMMQMWQSCRYDNALDECVADSLIASIAAQLLSRAVERDPHEQLAPVRLAPWRLQKVNQHLTGHLADASIDDLARVAGLSRRHFVRSFQQQTGQAPHRWLMHMRLERAKELLADGRESLRDIAFACGFASQSHFTSALKASSGYTPQRWREAHRLIEAPVPRRAGQDVLRA